MGLARRSIPAFFVLAAAVAALAALVGDLSAQRPEQHDLRYSVLVASLPTLEDARQIQQRHHTPGVPYYIVPVQVNRQVYYRVLAGLYPNREQATGLMNELVQQGIKESANAWHIRDSGLAFRLGSYVSEAESRRALAVALGDGFPAYTIVSITALGPRYEVMAGGFENRTEAAYLESQLAAVGMTQTLTQRRGVLPEDATRILAAADQAPAESEPEPEPEPAVTMASDTAGVREMPPPPTESPPSTADPERPPEEPVQQTDTGVLSGSLPSRPLPPPPQSQTSDGFAFSMGVAGGASPGFEAFHGYGGVLLHPRYGRIGLLVSGMLGKGAGYDSMAGYGALSLLVGDYGPLALWGYGGFGYYEETGVLDETKGLALPAAGAMLTYDVGPAQIIGGFTAMFGTYDEDDIDLRVYRGSLGVAYTTAPRGW